MSESEYFREANYKEEIPISDDVIAEQQKINNCDIIVFIYPIFWTEAPAKLVGWFDRVWTYGFAYGNRTMKVLNKAIVVCVAGRSLAHLKEHGHYDSMRNVMLDDRIFDRAKKKEMIILDGTTKLAMDQRRANWEKHLKVAFELGKNL